MIGARQRGAVICVLVALSLLSDTAAAAAATRYAGRTSQRAPVSFEISGGHLRKLRFTIYIKCPSRHIWRIGASNFAPIRIRHGRFSQRFVAQNGKASAVVRGRVTGRRVRGTLYDRTYEPKEHHFCAATARFELDVRAAG